MTLHAHNCSFASKIFSIFSVKSYGSFAFQLVFFYKGGYVEGGLFNGDYTIAYELIYERTFLWSSLLGTSHSVCVCFAFFSELAESVNFSTLVMS